MTCQENITAAEAMQALRKIMHDDPGYAYSWYANYAMAVYDVLPSSILHVGRLSLAREAATRFMKLAFDVEDIV